MRWMLQRGSELYVLRTQYLYGMWPAATTMVLDTNCGYCSSGISLWTQDEEGLPSCMTHLCRYHERSNCLCMCVWERKIQRDKAVRMAMPKYSNTVCGWQYANRAVTHAMLVSKTQDFRFLSSLQSWHFSFPMIATILTPTKPACMLHVRQASEVC